MASSQVSNGSANEVAPSEIMELDDHPLKPDTPIALVVLNGGDEDEIGKRLYVYETQSKAAIYEAVAAKLGVSGKFKFFLVVCIVLGTNVCIGWCLLECAIFFVPITHVAFECRYAVKSITNIKLNSTVSTCT